MVQRVKDVCLRQNILSAHHAPLFQASIAGRRRRRKPHEVSRLLNSQTMAICDRSIRHIGSNANRKFVHGSFSLWPVDCAQLRTPVAQLVRASVLWSKSIGHTPRSPPCKRASRRSRVRASLGVFRFWLEYWFFWLGFVCQNHSKTHHTQVVVTIFVYSTLSLFFGLLLFVMA
jgi:hypothetical protein